MYLFRGGDAQRTQQSPEQMQAHMEIWKTWMGNLAGSGKLVDGLPLGLMRYFLLIPNDARDVNCKECQYLLDFH